MLNANEAKKIGISACIDRLGYGFCKKYESSACTSWGLHDSKMFCCVGIDDEPYVPEKNPSRLILSEVKFRYTVSCDVDMNDGSIEYLECVTPGNSLNVAALSD